MALAPSLLITDDDSAFRETLQCVFEPMGFKTLLASDGEEAVSILRTEPVHLMLLDMHMPKLSGLETIKIVNKTIDRLPCILMSAELDDQIIAEAEAENVFSVLPKPVTRREIMGVVNRAMTMAYGWPGKRLTVRVRIVTSRPETRKPTDS